MKFTKMVSQEKSAKSTAMQELVDEKHFPEHFTTKVFRQISFLNREDCTVTFEIEDGGVSTVNLDANLGINLENVRIKSFVIHEENIPFTFLATI